jgi:hypothetical protein
MNGGMEMRPTWKIVLCSCGATLLVLGTGLLLMAVDVNCRWIGFGDAHTLYLDQVRPVTKRLGPLSFATDVWYDQFVELICPESLES